MIKTTLMLLIMLSIPSALALLVSCNTENPPSVTIGPGFFRSDEFHVEVQVPDGWAAVEGPERLIMTGHLQGQVAFNSWGQRGFWAHAVHPSGSVKSYRYGPEDVMSQIPEGGAYVALTLVSGPPSFGPEPPQYERSDLGGLYQPHDWRQDSATEAQFITFYKWGESFELVVAYHPDASDETVTQLNDLLQSWKFDKDID
jgi:hypothetical protein